MVRLLPRREPVTSDTPEAQVVRRAQAGDAEAFRALFVRYVPAVRRFLSDVVRHPPTADEATQETFVRAHSLLNRLTDPTRFKWWVLGIARNVGFEELRRRRSDDLELDDDAANAIQAVIPSPDPESLLLDRELEQHFNTALGELSAHRRTALVLRLDHGLPYEEIATVMGWSLQQVKNEIHRARLIVREQMVPHLGGRS